MRNLTLFALFTIIAAGMAAPAFADGELRVHPLAAAGGVDTDEAPAPQAAVTIKVPVVGKTPAPQPASKVDVSAPAALAPAPQARAPGASHQADAVAYRYSAPAQPAYRPPAPQGPFYSLAWPGVGWTFYGYGREHGTSIWTCRWDYVGPAAAQVSQQQRCNDREPPPGYSQSREQYTPPRYVAPYGYSYPPVAYFVPRVPAFGLIIVSGHYRRSR